MLLNTLYFVFNSSTVWLVILESLTCFNKNKARYANKCYLFINWLLKQHNECNNLLSITLHNLVEAYNVNYPHFMSTSSSGVGSSEHRLIPIKLPDRHFVKWPPWPFGTKFAMAQYLYLFVIYQSICMPNLELLSQNAQ